MLFYFLFFLFLFLFPPRSFQSRVIRCTAQSRESSREAVVIWIRVFELDHSKDRRRTVAHEKWGKDLCRGEACRSSSEPERNEVGNLEGENLSVESRAKQRKEASTWVRKGLKKHGRAQVRCKGICLVRQPNTGYWKHNCNEKDSNLVWHGMESLSGGFRAPAEEGGFSMQSY